ncbi:M15 family metallopeptidase [Nocardiopsis sp. MG754419]|uniref:M15 family metallopeptidase n=1 Tax=Nocardiopsis sp. MG754419 TaxID=2259865 RepID=UPI002011E0CF|nr:M15 family metallopeptidase [Nocardiopsis sp. MG754419]
MGVALLSTLALAAPAAAAPPNDLEVLRVELATARSDVAALREQASERIEVYLREAARLDEATEAREAADRRSRTAAEHREDRRLNAARQAAGAYKGADLDIAQAWTGSEGPVGLLERGAYLVLLGEHRSADLGRAEAARVAADTLSEAAGAAEEEQHEATEDAKEARESAEEAIEAQEERARGLLEQQTALEEALAATEPDDPQDEDTDDGADEARSDRAAEASGPVPDTEPAAAADPAEATEAREASEGVCAGDDVAGFDNGHIPDTVLCPLPQAGEMLRADAAESFVALDEAYRAEFGRPMCVTDSYRPYHEQVRLFQEMLPGMAARPGTSAHGLGIAVDLCGGVNEVGTAEHRWMLDQAPSHGWDNPDWARGGFEPWHWEYTP